MAFALVFAASSSLVLSLVAAVVGMLVATRVLVVERPSKVDEIQGFEPLALDSEKREVASIHDDPSKTLSVSDGMGLCCGLHINRTLPYCLFSGDYPVFQ